MQNELLISLERYDDDSDVAYYAIAEDSSDIESIVALRANDEREIEIYDVNHDERLSCSAERAAQLVKMCVLEEFAAHYDTCKTLKDLSEHVEAMFVHKSEI